MSLMPRHIIGDLDLTEWPFGIIRGSSDYGAPQNAAEVIDSMLQDGEIVSSTRSGNRVMSHSVFIEEADMAALARAEAALMAECDKQRNTWSIDPGDGYGAVTAFDIFRVQVAYVHDDNWEWAGYRRYDLTIPALPFARSVSKVSESFPPGASSPSITTLDDMSSAAGWSLSHGFLSAGGTTPLTYLNAAVSEDLNAYVTLTRAATVTAGDYLGLVTEGGRPYTLVVNGVELGPVATEGITVGTAALSRLWFFVGAGVKSVAVRWWDSGTPSYRFYDLVTSSDVPAGVARSVELRGSARAPVSLSVAASGGSLGKTLLVTGPKVGRYQPYILKGGMFANSTDWFAAPSGAYGLVAFLPSSFNGVTVTVTDSTSGQVITRKFRDTSLIQMLGTLHFGEMRGDGAITRRLTLGGEGSTSGVHLFLVPLDDDHAVTVGDFSSKYLFIDQPTVESDGGVFQGAQADGSDATPAWSSTRRHRMPHLAPPRTSVFVYPQTATVSAEYYPHWHTHAAE